MLTNVPKTIGSLTRSVTLRHPNSIPCVMLRKVVKRVESTLGHLGGLPTLGGIGVLSSEDEDDFDWEVLGGAMVLFTGTFPGSAQVERGDGLVPEPTNEALIEADGKPGTPEYFEPRRNDIVYVLIGQDVSLPFEIAGIESNVNIPPYTRRYILNARDDLPFLEDDVEEAIGKPSLVPDIED